MVARRSGASLPPGKKHQRPRGPVLLAHTRLLPAARRRFSLGRVAGTPLLAASAVPVVAPQAVLVNSRRKAFQIIGLWMNFALLPVWRSQAGSATMSQNAVAAVQSCSIAMALGHPNWGDSAMPNASHYEMSRQPRRTKCGAGPLTAVPRHCMRCHPVPMGRLIALNHYIAEV